MDLVGQPSEIAKAVGVPAYNLRKMLRNGEIRHSRKIGGRWYINASKEWPELKLERRVEDGK